MAVASAHGRGPGLSQGPLAMALAMGLAKALVMGRGFGPWPSARPGSSWPCPQQGHVAKTFAIVLAAALGHSLGFAMTKAHGLGQGHGWPGPLPAASDTALAMAPALCLGPWRWQRPLPWPWPLHGQWPCPVALTMATVLGHRPQPVAMAFGQIIGHNLCQRPGNDHGSRPLLRSIALAMDVAMARIRGDA